MWRRVAGAWRQEAKPDLWSEVTPPLERLVIPEVDPATDLARRGAAWGLTMEAADLAELSRFAASLATTEATAWQAGDGSVATRAYSDRRFLFADRVLPWVVPWLLAVAARSRSTADEALRTSRRLLVLGEHHRPAPTLVSGEGIHLPGYDGFGPLGEPAGARDRLASLWGGMVRFRVAGGEAHSSDDVSAEYSAAASEWETLAEMYPGSGGYWCDLAARARLTAAALGDR